MIVEGIVSTVSRQGQLNLAPMGIRLVRDFDEFLLRPYQTSTTYRNLLETSEGVFHVTDDVLAFARLVAGIDRELPCRPALTVRGMILEDCCRYHEFRVARQTSSEERAEFVGVTVERGWLRDFLGFNRAKNAVIEAAILATRVGILPAREIAVELSRLEVIVGKTGRGEEREALETLKAHVSDRMSKNDQIGLPT